MEKEIIIPVYYTEDEDDNEIIDYDAMRDEYNSQIESLMWEEEHS